MELKRVIEAILIASPEPLTAHELASMLKSAARSAKAELRELAKAAGVVDKGAEDEKPEGKKKGKKGDKNGAKKAKEKEKSGKKGKKAVELEQGDEDLEMDGASAAGRPELAFAKVSDSDVEAAIEELEAGYRDGGSAFTLQERAEGWKIFTRSEYAPWVGQLYPDKKPERLSAPALETLAIVAYRQPITKAAIEAVRGVNCDGVMQTLLDRNIVRIAGRAEVPGRPLLYETTELFFEHFGIRSVDDLPNAAELRTVQLPEPEKEKDAKEGAGAEPGPGDDGQEATSGDADEGSAHSEATGTPSPGEGDQQQASQGQEKNEAGASSAPLSAGGEAVEEAVAEHDPSAR